MFSVRKSGFYILPTSATAIIVYAIHRRTEIPAILSFLSPSTQNSYFLVRCHRKD